MSAAVIVVASIFVGVVVIWRTSASASPRARPRTVSLIQRERRRQSRIVPTPERPAELQIMGKDFLEIPEVRDISENGLAISVPHKFNGHKPTQEVDLLLTLHGQGTVRARGAIRHVSYTRNDTATFGVELVSIDDEGRDKIRKYVEKVQEGVPEPVQEDPSADAAAAAPAARRTR